MIGFLLKYLLCKVQKSVTIKSDETQSHCGKSDNITGYSTTHGSDEALKINKVQLCNVQ